LAPASSAAAVLRTGGTGPDEPCTPDLPGCDQAALLGTLDLAVDRRAGTPTRAVYIGSGGTLYALKPPTAASTDPMPPDPFTLARQYRQHRHVGNIDGNVYALNTATG
jgi:hypothetical protein